MTDAPSSLPVRLPCAIAPYVPHQHGMCLLDTLLEASAEHLVAAVTPQRHDLFATAEGIPGWVGLEWFAQAVAAWAGMHSARHGDAPRIGFLLGTRRYRCHSPWFAFGRPLRVAVTLDFRADNGLGAFRGELFDDADQLLATTTLNVFQPESPQALDAIQQGASL